MKDVKTLTVVFVLKDSINLVAVPRLCKRLLSSQSIRLASVWKQIYVPLLVGAHTKIA